MMRGARAPSQNRVLWISAALVAAVALGLIAWSRSRESSRPRPGPDARVGATRQDETPRGSLRPLPARSRPSANASPLGAPGPQASWAEEQDPASSEISAPPSGFDPAAGGRRLDLDALRERLPDNLYWRFGAPTSNPQVLAERAEHDRRMQESLGRINSGTASEKEIRAYFDEQRQLSEDYLAFVKEVLTDHGDELSEEERGLYELAGRMHAARLKELDRRIQDALARKRLQDERRAAWRAAGSPVPANP
jgi:hypothetical protein